MNAHAPFTPAPHADPVDVHVGARVRMLRKELGHSQTALAEALGLTFQQVQKYERGFNRISASKLWEIARYLGCGVDYFFAGLAAETAAGADPLHDNAIREAMDRPRIRRLAREASALTDDQADTVLAVALAIKGGRA